MKKSDKINEKRIKEIEKNLEELGNDIEFLDKFFNSRIDNLRDLVIKLYEKLDKMEKEKDKEKKQDAKVSKV